MNSTAAEPQLTAPQPSPIELEVRRIRELAKSQRHAEALAAAEALTARVPVAGDQLVLRRRANARPNFGDAYWSLANLKTYRFLDEEIARMRAEETAPGTPLDHRQITNPSDQFQIQPVIKLGDGARDAQQFRFLDGNECAVQSVAQLIAQERRVFGTGDRRSPIWRQITRLSSCDA